MGYSIIHGKSGKQKINVKSSTKLDLVGTCEYIPYNIWMVLFLATKRYKMKKKIAYQDNQSTIQMLENGRNSCTGNSRHINLSFFVKYKITKGEFKVIYCHTKLMLADYFTKPLVG